MNRRGKIALFVLADAVGLVCAYFWAFVLYLGTDFEARRPNWEIFAQPEFALALLALRLLVYEMCGLYDLGRDSRLGRDMLYGLLATVIAGFLEMFALLLAKTFYVTDLQPSRGLVLTYMATSYVALLFWRAIYYWRRGGEALKRRYLLVGAGPIAAQIWREIDRFSGHGDTMVGFVDDDVSAEMPQQGHAMLGACRDLPRLVAAHEISDIIVTSSQATRTQMLDLLSTCQQTGARVRLLPELYEVMIGKVAIDPVAGVPLISLPSLNPGLRPPVWKRVCDVLGALVGLAVMAGLHPLIAAAIKLTSRGPVFYSQERVGMHQRRYTLYKYRTMVVDAEKVSGPTLADENDPRITAVGRWLRRSHLDELPQFWNVLRGDMSLVGPRPERPEFVTQHAARVPAYRFRFLLRPGITGLAQIHSYYASDASHKLRYDIAYMNTLNILLDCKILLLTLKVLVTGRRIA